MSDLAKVYSIESASQNDPWTEQQFVDELCNNASTIDLYCCQDEPVGFLCSWLIAGELQIQNLVVAKKFRSEGIASRLLKFVLNRSCELGLESAWLEVRATNRGAIALYQKFGFITVTRREAYYHDGEDALIMTYQPGNSSMLTKSNREYETE